MLINYTPRYYSKYWLIIIHSILINLEKKYLNGVTPPINFNERYYTGIKIDINSSTNLLARKTRTLLRYIEKKIIISPKIDSSPLFTWSVLYHHDKSNFIVIPIKKNEQYNQLKWGYQSSLNIDTPDWALIFGVQLNKHNKYVFNNLGVYRFPKSESMLEDNVYGVKYSSKLVSAPKIFELPPLPKLGEITTNIKSCMYSAEKEKVNNINNLDFDELYCVNNGGVWDGPCITNKDCPFLNAGIDTCMANGKCKLPYGIERIGYTYYNKKNIPYCNKCNNLDFDRCCDGNKYKLKWSED